MPKNRLVLYSKSVYSKKTEQSKSETKKNGLRLIQSVDPMSIVQVSNMMYLCVYYKGIFFFGVDYEMGFVLMELVL